MPGGRGPGLNRSKVLPTISRDWFTDKVTPNSVNTSSRVGNKARRIRVETSKRPVNPWLSTYREVSPGNRDAPWL